MSHGAAGCVARASGLSSLHQQQHSPLLTRGETPSWRKRRLPEPLIDSLRRAACSKAGIDESEFHREGHTHAAAVTARAIFAHAAKRLHYGSTAIGEALGVSSWTVNYYLGHNARYHKL